MYTMIMRSLSESLIHSPQPDAQQLEMRFIGRVAVYIRMYVYYYRTYEKAVSGGGEREKGGHVLRDTTSRGLYVRVWPPHTSERRGGGGGCEQEGWQGGEGRARMSGQEERQRHIRRC